MKYYYAGLNPKGSGAEIKESNGWFICRFSSVRERDIFVQAGNLAISCCRKLQKNDIEEITKNYKSAFQFIDSKLDFRNPKLWTKIDRMEVLDVARIYESLLSAISKSFSVEIPTLMGRHVEICRTH